MKKYDFIIIGGPRKYKETGPLTKAGFRFEVIEYDDRGAGKFFRLLRNLLECHRRFSKKIIFSDMLNISYYRHIKGLCQ